LFRSDSHPFVESLLQSLPASPVFKASSSWFNAWQDFSNEMLLGTRLGMDNLHHLWKDNRLDFHLVKN
jgi:hypothetical protein